jgi:hypothetical protein
VQNRTDSRIGSRHPERLRPRTSEDRDRSVKPTTASKASTAAGGASRRGRSGTARPHFEHSGGRSRRRASQPTGAGQPAGETSGPGPEVAVSCQLSRDGSASTRSVNRTRRCLPRTGTGVERGDRLTHDADPSILTRRSRPVAVGFQRDVAVGVVAVRADDRSASAALWPRN